LNFRVLHINVIENAKVKDLTSITDPLRFIKMIKHEASLSAHQSTAKDLGDFLFV